MSNINSLVINPFFAGSLDQPLKHQPLVHSPANGRLELLLIQPAGHPGGDERAHAGRRPEHGFQVGEPAIGRGQGRIRQARRGGGSAFL